MIEQPKSLVQIFKTKLVRSILKCMGLKFSKPYPQYYRRPPNAEKHFKKYSELPTFTNKWIKNF